MLTCVHKASWKRSDDGLVVKSEYSPSLRVGAISRLAAVTECSLRIVEIVQLGRPQFTSPNAPKSLARQKRL